MKIRNGFVSNSSSSSFILIGKPSDPETFDFENEYVMLGESPDGQSDLITLDKDMIKAILKYQKKHQAVWPHPIYVNPLVIISDEGYEEMEYSGEIQTALQKFSDTDKGVKLIFGTCAQDAADDFDEFKSLYLEE